VIKKKIYLEKKTTHINEEEAPPQPHQKLDPRRGCVTMKARQPKKGKDIGSSDRELRNRKKRGRSGKVKERTEEGNGKRIESRA